LKLGSQGAGQGAFAALTGPKETDHGGVGERRCESAFERPRVEFRVCVQLLTKMASNCILSMRPIAHLGPVYLTIMDLLSALDDSAKLNQTIC
jgi:hypothetical protein